MRADKRAYTLLSAVCAVTLLSGITAFGSTCICETECTKEVFCSECEACAENFDDCTGGAGLKTISPVYLDRTEKDGGDGSEENPVNSLDKAVELAGENGTIVVLNYIPIEKDKELDSITFIRGENYKGKLFQVTSGAELTLNNVTIDGNKDNVEMGSNGQPLVFVSGENSSLIINKGTKICNNDTTAVMVEKEGSVTMNGGEISENNGYGAYGGGIHIFSKSVFTMNGGSINNNTACTYDGGGISIEASNSTEKDKMAQFYMKGGRVENNSAENGCGGGILNYGYAELSGGEIKNNTSSWGGGIAAVGNSKTILDGTVITENECGGNGAGVYIEGFTNINGEKCVFEMKSGKITGNSTSNGNGGGIFAYYWTNMAEVIISGGIISDNSAYDSWGTAIALNSGDDSDGPLLYLSGSPEIEGNVLLRNDSYSGMTINIAEDFEPDKPVEVAVQNRYSGFVIVNCDGMSAPDSGNFTVYTDDYEVVVKDNALILAQITRIEITAQPELDYKNGDKLDLSSLKITVNYDEGDSAVIGFDDDELLYSIDGENISDGDSIKKAYDGKTISIEYKGMTVETDIISVKDDNKSSGGSYSLEEGHTDRDNDKNTETKPEEEGPFYDVSKDDPNYDAIMTVYENGWMEGVSEGVFAANGTLTRGMAAQILWNKAGKPEPVNAAPFLDVTSDAWYAKAVAWAYEQGIVLGYDAVTYGPNDFVTTEQFTIMLDKLEGRTPAAYVGGAPNATRGWVASQIA